MFYLSVTIIFISMVNRSEGVADAAVSELERRNAELAALLQQEREASQKQTQLGNHLVSTLFIT